MTSAPPNSSASPADRRLPLLVVGAAFAQGFLSMGFQLVASRLLAPFFGTTLFVWAFIMATFLAAFSAGAIIGGVSSRLPAIRARRSLTVIGVLGTLGFLLTAVAGRPCLRAIDGLTSSFIVGLALSCPALFLLPVTALSAVLPLMTEGLTRRGQSGGLSSGMVYGTSTLGNIVGVMATAFLLIPNLPTSRILVLWVFCAGACFWVFRYIGGRAFQERSDEVRITAPEPA